MIHRFLVVFFSLLPFAVAFLRDYRKFILFGPPRAYDPTLHARRAQKLRQTIARLGPTFIKLIQILSSRADLFPKDYIDQLRLLHDKVPPFPTDQAKQTIAADLGAPVAVLFEDFSDTPLAAASLGQVHRARYQGETVAVKVLRPGVRALIRTDLRILSFILYFLNLFLPHHTIRAVTTIVEEFARIVSEEMDFQQEAHYVQRFREIFKDDDRVIIPKVYTTISSRRVLILEYLEGIPINRIDQIVACGIDFKRVLALLIEIYARQILYEGLFHADPHPGNILVTTQGKIVLLDFGMVIIMDTETRQEFLGAVTAIVKKDYEGLVRSFYRLKMIDPHINPSVMRDAARELVELNYREETDLKKIQQITQEILATFYKFPLQLPANMVYIFKIAVLIEGIGIQYDPNFNGIRAATPIAKNLLAKELLTPKQDLISAIVQQFQQAHDFLKNLQRVVQRAEREELGIRLYRGDLFELEHFISYIVRKLVATMFFLGLSLISVLLYLAWRHWLILVLGLATSLFLLLFALALPHRPRWRPIRIDLLPK